MANNPKFEMQGINFIISSPGAQQHALPFELRQPDGQRVEIQRALKASFSVFDVIAELRGLADDLAAIATGPGRLDYPAAVSDSGPLPLSEDQSPPLNVSPPRSPS